MTAPDYTSLVQGHERARRPVRQPTDRSERQIPALCENKLAAPPMVKSAR